MSKYAKIIAVDFDGTLVEDKWPEIGQTNVDILLYCKQQKAGGAKIILWTNRRDKELVDAVVWCFKHGLELDAVNEDVPETIARFGGSSRKIYADEFIDDRAIDISKFEEPKCCCGGRKAVDTKIDSETLKMLTMFDNLMQGLADK